MKANRRDFLRKAAIGSAAITTGIGLSGFRNINIRDNSKNNTRLADQVSEKWDVSFDESASSLLLKNGPVTIQGQLKYTSGTGSWNITKSRYGSPRYSINGDSKDVRSTPQQFFVIDQNLGKMQFNFYHRSALQTPGTLEFRGKISFTPDSFACRTRMKPDEKVLSLSCNSSDSLLNDSLFAPETDTAFRLDASAINIRTEGEGSYSFTMSGEVGEWTETVFTLNLDRDYFRNRYVPSYHPLDRKRMPRNPTGWMSWNTYFDTATADDNLNEAKIGKKYFQPFGCEFWSMESWQGNSDILPVRNFYNMNLETSEKKVPKGMKKLADDIRKLGFRPGIWMAPFGTGNKEFYESHKSWFLHDKDGKPIPCWNGNYTMDPTVPEALENLARIHRVASHEWGYEYFKIDGIGNTPYERADVRARFHDPSVANPFGDCLRIIREAIGEDRVLLACGGRPSGPEAAYSDAFRVAGDIVTQFKPPKWSGLVRTARSFVNQAYANNVLMVSDPDTLLVRELPVEEARVYTTMVALPGQHTFFGDKLAKCSPEQIKMLQQTLPVVPSRPVSLYPYFSDMYVWNLRVQTKIMDDYNVVALFNWDDDAKNISFSTDELGIDSEPDYVLYEFWTKKNLGSMNKSFSMEVPAHGVRLIAMHKAKKTPQWLSSDRHVVQNAMELTQLAWDDEKNTMTGKIQLIGTFPVTMFLRVPDNYSFKQVKCEKAKCRTEAVVDNILPVTFSTSNTGTCDFTMQFEKIA